MWVQLSMSLYTNLTDLKKFQSHKLFLLFYKYQNIPMKVNNTY